MPWWIEGPPTREGAYWCVEKRTHLDAPGRHGGRELQCRLVVVHKEFGSDQLWVHVAFEESRLPLLAYGWCLRHRDVEWPVEGLDGVSDENQG